MTDVTPVVKAKPDTLIGEILMEYPETQDVMIKYFGEEVACVFCPGQAFDTFEMIADLHGIEPDVVDEMLVEMNALVDEIDAERKADEKAEAAVEALAEGK